MRWARWQDAARTQGQRPETGPVTGGSLSRGQPRCRLLLHLALLTALSGPANALAAGSPLDFRLEALRSGATETLDRLTGKPTFLVFFEPRCRWCAKQIEALQALREGCSKRFRAVAIGVHGDRAGYRRFLRRAEVELPAYRASPQLVAAIGGVPATPYSLFLEADGTPSHRLRGAIPAPKLRQWLADEGVACPGTGD